MNTTMTDRNTSESHAAPAMERMRYARRFCRTTALVAVMMLLNAVKPRRKPAGKRATSPWIRSSLASARKPKTGAR